LSFYELQTPSQWAEPPRIWSSTSIDEIEACPLRWQLLRSRWGEYERFPLRPSPAAIEGQIVHDALDRLTRLCGQRGNPPFGSAEFALAINEAEFFVGFVVAVEDWQEKLAAHPRPGPPFRLRTSPEELANRSVRMFREQYEPLSGMSASVCEPANSAMTHFGDLLRSKGALSEVRLQHPDLAFLGILDRVQLCDDGVEVVDFKTGRPNEKHRLQLLRYALLWWRTTGEMPIRVSAQYLNGAEFWVVAEAELSALEVDLAATLPQLGDLLLSRPAVSKPSKSCRTCPVRARCDAGWATGQESGQIDGTGDAELVVSGIPSDHGFLSVSLAGADVAVVFEPGIAGLLPEQLMGRKVRILDGAWKEKRTQFEIRAWTEVFLVEEDVSNLLPGA
jgi:hypothetical protein